MKSLLFLFRNKLILILLILILSPLLEKNPRFFLMGGLFLHVPWRPFCQFFVNFFFMCMGGRGLFGLASPPYENFCGRPRSFVVRNFSCGTLSWHYGHISYCYRAKGGGECLNKWSFIMG